MKRQIGRFSAVMAAILIVLCAGCGRPVDTVQAEKRFNSDLSQGQVRVVLLRAGPTASATNRPTFSVTYGVEVPRRGAFSDLSFSSKDEIALVVAGKPIDSWGECSSASMGFSELPGQSELRQPVLHDGTEMIFEEVIFTGLHIEAKQIDIRLRFSWRGSPLSFDFKNVPVGYRSANPGS